MCDDEILWLAGQTRQGLAFWRDSDGKMLKITRVSTEPVDVDGDDCPVPTAFLEGGNHIDLTNTDPDDLFTCQAMFS